MKPRPRLTAFDRRLLTDEPAVVGVDEAGRGSLAGPVVAAAVHLPREFYDSNPCRRLRPLVHDSKQRTPMQRERAMDLLRKARKEGRISIASASASVEEIAAHNILGATRLAMRRALDQVLEAARCPGEVWQEVDENDLFFNQRTADLIRRRPLILVDGKPLRPFFYPHQALVRGDSLSFAIAAASIVAKVTRDALMNALGEEFPDYGFAQNKGYGTPSHLEAIRKHGSCRIHREGFVKEALSGQGGPWLFPVD